MFALTEADLSLRLLGCGDGPAAFNAALTKEGRYITGELPPLPFEQGEFDITLSSHLRFLYSAHLSAEFHLQALKEMLVINPV